MCVVEHPTEQTAADALERLLCSGWHVFARKPIREILEHQVALRFVRKLIEKDCLVGRLIIELRALPLRSTLPIGGWRPYVPLLCHRCSVSSGLPLATQRFSTYLGRKP